tara:strand:- start:125 stop:448 length:324 start_codon:yes stop_codon:yes gene_type:complete
MENQIFAAVIRSVKTFTITNKNEQNVLCSVAIVKLTDGSITKVFAYDMDLTQGFSLADVTRIPHGTPLYDGGPTSAPGQDLVFEGAMSLEHALTTSQAMTVSKELDL